MHNESNYPHAHWAIAPCLLYRPPHISPAYILYPSAPDDAHMCTKFRNFANTLHSPADAVVYLITVAEIGIRVNKYALVLECFQLLSKLGEHGACVYSATAHVERLM